MAQSYRTQLLAAIAEVLPVRAFRELDRTSPDRWGWYPLAVVWLLPILCPGATLKDRFAQGRIWLRRLAPRLRLAGTYQGFVKALRRRGEMLTFWLRTAVQERVREQLGNDDLVGGWRPLAVDGTRFDCPRSRSCQKEFPLASRRKSSPQLTLTGLWHLGVHCWYDGRVGAARISERAMLRDMLDDLPEWTLLVGDAGFVGYELCAELSRRRIAFLLRVGRNIQLLTRLGLVAREDSGTVYLWPQAHRGQPPLRLRLLVVGSGKRRVYLVTSVLSRRQLSHKRAADFYRRRWGVETAYRAIKQTLARRKLLSRAADLARWELVGIFLAVWMLSIVSLFARGARARTQAWSPAQTIQTLRQALDNADRRAVSLRRRLAQALAEQSRRGHKKARRGWPRQKTEPPCGAPTIKQATTTLILKAQRFVAIAA
jgi:Transposase DDE domain